MSSFSRRLGAAIRAVRPLNMCYAGKPVTVGHEGRPTDASKRIPKAEVVNLVSKIIPTSATTTSAGSWAPQSAGGP